MHVVEHSQTKTNLIQIYGDPVQSKVSYDGTLAELGGKKGEEGVDEGRTLFIRANGGWLCLCADRKPNNLLK